MKALRWSWMWLGRIARFGRRVVSAFLNNRGILLAGGVGYNALLSLVPFLTLTVGALSLFFDHQHILAMLRTELRVLVPQNAEAILAAAETYLQHQATTSVVSVLLLLFFSSIAFRMLEQAVAAIFHTSSNGLHRHFLASAVLPYSFMVLLMGALFFITLLTSTLDAVGEALLLKGSLDFGTNLLLRAAGWAGLVLLFAAIYRVLPVVKISNKRALVGGLCAAVLWQLVGRFMVYYFANLSVVNAIYGSLATVVVMLLFMEIAFVILLLGAQVIAELVRSAAAGVPWWETPKNAPPRADDWPRPHASAAASFSFSPWKFRGSVGTSTDQDQ
ncbi:MAG: YihY/virulence factor BrkB family protein [Archangium sp.]|nr:YihY/virulence factor BrkB family protein [Archangium sp.]